MKVDFLFLPFLKIYVFWIKPFLSQVIILWMIRYKENENKWISCM